MRAIELAGKVSEIKSLGKSRPTRGNADDDNISNGVSRQKKKNGG